MTDTTEIIGAGQLALPELAEGINIRVQAAEARARSALQYALEAGQLLNQAKDMVPHGQWNDWLVENCIVAPRTARSYMRLAKTYPSLPEPERQRVADLPVRDAVKAIATDPTPPVHVAPAKAPSTRQDRERVVDQFQKAAKSIREASRWFSYGMDLKPAKVTALRNKLQDILSELARLQQQGER